MVDKLIPRAVLLAGVAAVAWVLFKSAGKPEKSEPARAPAPEPDDADDPPPARKRKKADMPDPAQLDDLAPAEPAA